MLARKEAQNRVASPIVVVQLLADAAVARLEGEAALKGIEGAPSLTVPQVDDAQVAEQVGVEEFALHRLLAKADGVDRRPDRSWRCLRRR